MAQRIQNKRSSIAGKRPSGEYLEPGEIALNTNSSDPGLYFETNDGLIAKAGPTSIGPEPPVALEGWGNGETWYNTGNQSFQVYSSATEEWKPILAPFFGGSPNIIFVGTQFPEASDDLSNDGNSRPFATLNRACLEVARRSILFNRSDDPSNAKTAIVLLPGENTVFNDPGISREEFLDNFEPFEENASISPKQYRDLNPYLGGLIIPRGASIFGLDLRKTILRPSYYPEWTRSKYESASEFIEERTSTLKWTGNCYINSLTFRDKKENVSVTAITDLDGNSADDNDIALLRSLEPHGYRALIFNDDGEPAEFDTVTLSYPENVSRIYKNEATLSPGDYIVEPVGAKTFKLLRSDGSAVLRKELPEFPGPGTVPNEFLSLYYQNTTHHRLSAISWAKKTELDDYYIKVQKAFANLDFGGKINDAEVSLGENVIVADLPETPEPKVDTVKNGSPYLFNASLRSEYGQCGVTADGFLVDGFKSALSCNFTTVSLQNDAEVFEVYYNKKWISLKQAYALANSVNISTVTNEQAIQYLITAVKIEDFRYFARDAKDISADANKSSGIIDDESDTRHYNTLVSNDALMQIVSSFAIGPAINYWARHGGNITVSNANSNFGGESLCSDGFSGLGTIGGAVKPDTGFAIQGVRRPLLINSSQLADPSNHRFIELNSKIASLNSSNNTITLETAFDKTFLLPYTLRAGTVIWVKDLSDNLLYSSLLSSNPISEDGLTISLNSQNDNITSRNLSNLGVPFIRRFVDPREPSQKDLQLWISNTSPDHRPPAVGSVLRYAENPNPGFTDLLVTGRQLDPGESGGWNHVFSVRGAVNKEDGDNPNFGGISRSPIEAGQDYYISLSLCDSFKPWIGDRGEKYAQGFLSTLDFRAFYAEQNALVSGQDAELPTSTDSPWTRSKTFAYCQPTDEAFVPPDYDSAVDPDSSGIDPYEEGSTYLRGFSVESSSYEGILLIDSDDGTSTLGLQGSSNPLYIDPDLESLTESHSYLSVARFFKLLGYSENQIASLLKPQLWNDRNLATTSASFPSPGDTGYAISKGTWPIEFNQPSKLISTSHTWEFAGYFNYAKALPKYQDSPLTLRQRFDYITSTKWGGYLTASGSTESGESVLAGFLEVDSSGREVTTRVDYRNIANAPTIPTNNNQLINGAGYLTNADGGNASLLNGQPGSYYLDYNNFTNTPTNLAEVIQENTTLFVATNGNDSTGNGTSGSPWATPQKAAQYLSQRRIKTDVSVVVSIAAGTYTFTSPINLNHPQGSQITYAGASTTGAKPTGSKLDGGGVRGYTTATEAHNDALLKAYYTTRFQFNNTLGIVVNADSAVQLSNILLRGSGPSIDVEEYDGINVGYGKIQLSDCAVHNFKTRGIAVVFGGRADLLSGVSVTNCAGGISNSSGIILGDVGGGLTISNCNGDGINILRSGTARIKDSYISNNGRDGLSALENSSARANSSVFTNNGRRGVVCRENSSIQVRGSIVTNNGDTGVLATAGGYIDFINNGDSPSVLSGNRSPSAPALNTLGNSASFIKSNIG